MHVLTIMIHSTNHPHSNKGPHSNKSPHSDNHSHSNKGPHSDNHSTLSRASKDLQVFQDDQAQQELRYVILLLLYRE